MNLKIYSNKTIATLSILFFTCTTEPQECRIGFTEIDGKCYSEVDLTILEGFINNSSTTIPMIWAADTSSSIGPLDLGIQEWNENGRLTLLWLYDYTINDDYTMSGEIPENIGNLTELKKINLAVNQITGNIPESIGKLKNLKFFYLYHNQLSGIITDSICNIYPNLEHFQIYENQFCPPYPNCIPIDKIGTQDTSQCL